MWNDVETTQDLLNFTVVADTVAELIIEADNQPISIGVSGNWGAGKSSMVKMIGESLKKSEITKDDKEKPYVFLEFNAWLYQGYDDAKAALLQAVSDKLLEETKKRKPAKEILEKVQDFSKRLNWLTVSRILLPLAIGLLPGGIAAGGIGSLVGAVSGIISSVDVESKKEKLESLNAAIESLSPELKDLVKSKETNSTPQKIEKLREEFEDILDKLNITLVVLVDDLDRCLPSTAISTLEAMRLLLFVKRTAFVIAADEQMIRSSVRAHFSNMEINDGLVTSYFDKLIQIPISVPHLGIAEVKVYLVSLFTELAARKKEITDETSAKARSELQDLLRNAWQGGISKAKIEGVFDQKDLEKLREGIDISEQIAGILVTADNINGNPRLIKRFLNAIMIQDKVAKLNGMTVDFNSLVKMMLFERCASSSAFEYLVKCIKQSPDGKPTFLNDIEIALSEGKEPTSLEDSWKSEFITEWLKLDPKLGDTDLRPLLYLSRDRSLSLAAFDELSKEAREILSALSKVDNVILQDFVNRIKLVGEAEAEKLLSRIARTGRNNQWEIQTLVAELHIAEAYPNLGGRLVGYLKGIPPKARKPAFVPHLCSKSWASDLLCEWEKDPNTPTTVSKAIAMKKEK